MVMSDQDLIEKREQLKRRLAALETKEAIFGHNLPVHEILEIKDTKEQIEKLNKRIQSLSDKSNNTATDNKHTSNRFPWQGSKRKPELPPSPFVGRKQEVKQLISYFRRKNTSSSAIVHGWGGIGKTALVCKVAAELEKKIPLNCQAY